MTEQSVVSALSGYQNSIYQCENSEPPKSQYNNSIERGQRSETSLYTLNIAYTFTTCIYTSQIPFCVTLVGNYV